MPARDFLEFLTDPERRLKRNVNKEIKAGLKEGLTVDEVIGRLSPEAQELAGVRPTKATKATVINRSIALQKDRPEASQEMALAFAAQQLGAPELGMRKATQKTPAQPFGRTGRSVPAPEGLNIPAGEPTDVADLLSIGAGETLSPEEALGPTRAQKATETAQTFGREGQIAALTATVASSLGLSPEQARDVAEFAFLPKGSEAATKARAKLPKNLRMVAEITRLDSQLRTDDITRQSRIAQAKASTLDQQLSYVKLLNALQKNPKLDQAIKLIGALPKGTNTDRFKAAFVTANLQRLGITNKELKADPRGTLNIIDFIFGGFTQKFKPQEDIVIPNVPGISSDLTEGLQSAIGGGGAIGLPGAPQGAATVSPITEPRPGSLLPTELRREVSEFPTAPRPEAPLGVGGTGADVAGTETGTFARTPAGREDLIGLDIIMGQAARGEFVELPDGTQISPSPQQVLEAFLARHTVDPNLEERLRRDVEAINQRIRSRTATDEGFQARIEKGSKTIGHSVMGLLSPGHARSPASKATSVIDAIQTFLGPGSSAPTPPGRGLEDLSPEERKKLRKRLQRGIPGG